MTFDVADSAIDFMAKISPENEPIHITFHGGEPLLAVEGYYDFVLPRLQNRFGRNLRLSLQSNLLALDEHIQQLIRKYDIAVGTSLDGFEQMCDDQRGAGYFARNNTARASLRQHGIPSSCICTFTHEYANRDDVRRVFDSYITPYSIHGAVTGLGEESSRYTLSVEDMTCILTESLAVYRENIGKNRITTIDAMARGCFEGQGSVCTFFDCLGRFAAISADGGIYSCQRFCGHEEYCLGNVLNNPSERQILDSEAYQRMLQNQMACQTACGECPHFPYCKGGCQYNRITAKTEKDPYCEAYQKTFEILSTGQAMEMSGLMTGRISPDQAPLLAMAGDLAHPYDLEQSERRMRVALRRAMPGREGMPDMKQHRQEYPEKYCSKLYLHITFNCPSRCDHCYANAGEAIVPEMPAKMAANVVHEAQRENFSAVVITGGEPLVHGRIDTLLTDIAEIDRKGMRLILRTSLAFPIRDELLLTICDVCDEVVVSIDGDRLTHDARRGEGRFDQTVMNLERLKVIRGLEKISVCTTLPKTQCERTEGQAVRNLCRQLGISRIRFRPVLPLGRASGISAEWSFTCMDAEESVKNFHARHTCGLGQNLYVEPDGSAYPCYAWCGKDKLLGNINSGLSGILNSGAFRELLLHDVDTNEKCRTCRVRYLCGGICKAWVNDRLNIDSGDFDCAERETALIQIAEKITM